TLSNLVHHLIGLAILLAVLLIFHGIHLSAAWILLYMVMLLMLAQGLGWIVAGLHVFVRDTIQALQILLMLWFYFTPILYSLEMLQRVSSGIRFVAALNPMAVIVTGYRNSLLNLAQPTTMQIASVFAICIVVFVAGAVLFRQAKPAFPDVL